MFNGLMGSFFEKFSERLTAQSSLPLHARRFRLEPATCNIQPATSWFTAIRAGLI
jgi:hypothetical protein